MRQLALPCAPLRPPRRAELSFKKLHRALHNRFGIDWTDARLDESTAHTDWDYLSDLTANSAIPEFADYVRAGKLIKAISARELAYLVDVQYVANDNFFDNVFDNFGAVVRTRSLLEYVLPCAPKMRILLKRGADPHHVGARDDGTPAPVGASLVETLIRDETLPPTRAGANVLRLLFEYGVTTRDLDPLVVFLRYSNPGNCIWGTWYRQIQREDDARKRRRRVIARGRLFAVYGALVFKRRANSARMRAWLPESVHVSKLRERFYARISD